MVEANYVSFRNVMLDRQYDILNKKCDTNRKEITLADLFISKQNQCKD
jgi:hypothetical protein